MKKILLAGIIATSALFAQTNVENTNKTVKKHHRINKHNFMSLIKHLKLTSTQKNKIKIILKDSRKNRIKKDNALISSIKNDKFDKNNFIKIREEIMKAKIEKRASIIAKIYTILRAQQKKEIITLLNSKKAKK